MKRMSVVLAVVLAVGLVFSPAFGQISSSKGSGMVVSLSLIEYNSYAPLMWQEIKVPQSKELVFDVSLEGTLMTDTLVKSKKGVKDTEMAKAWIKAKVFIVPLAQAVYTSTGAPDIDAMKDIAIKAYPTEGVTFVERTQEMMAKFAGGFFDTCLEDDVDGNCTLWANPDGCMTVDQDGYVKVEEDCTFQEEELQLILTTTSANAFNFILGDIDQGEYLVVVAGEASGTAPGPDSKYDALINKGSLVVDQARFVKDENVNP